MNTLKTLFNKQKISYNFEILKNKTIDKFKNNMKLIRHFLSDYDFPIIVIICICLVFSVGIYAAILGEQEKDKRDTKTIVNFILIHNSINTSREDIIKLLLQTYPKNIEIISQIVHDETSILNRPPEK